MIDTELLLRHTPEDAIVMMVNAENGTHFPTGTFTFGLPEVISGRETRIHLKVRDSVHKEDIIPYEGEFDFTYRRLDLANHFQDVLAGFYIPLPTSTQVVLDELNRRLDQDFFLDDIVLEEIGRNNAAPYRLKAKVESLRWIGELEIHLAEHSDLNAFFSSAILSNDSTRMGSLNTKAQLQQPQVNSPFTNATHRQDLIELLVEGNYAQDQGSLLPLMQQVVAEPNQALNPQTSPWVLESTPAPFNVYNARMLEVPYPSVGVNPVNENLTHAVRFVLDQNYCTNLNDPEVLIPYRVDDFTTSQFNREPRLTRYAVKSLTDGSAFARYLNGIAQGAVLTTLAGSGGPFLINGPDPYVTERFIPGPRNLYGSTVLYNGQLRSIDNSPVNPSLNRVMVLALTNMNTAYKGNFAIHYRAPIFLPAALAEGKLNLSYNYSLAASEGVGPYSYLIYEGAFAPGHDIHPTTGLVSGVATAVGFYTVGIEVIDSRGVGVRYLYTYAITAAPLLVTGFAPDGQVGQAYSFTYPISGGVGPYTNTLVGLLPPGVVFNPATCSLIGTPTAEAIGPYSWTIKCKDQAGTEIFRTDSIVIGAA